MKNEKYSAGSPRGLSLALPVPDGTLNGVPTEVGADKLLIVPETDRVTAALRAAGKAPQGLPDGYASCFIPGVTQILDLGAMPAGTQNFDKLYRSAAGALTKVNTDIWVGWAIPLPAPALGMGVGIRSN